jgi:hypothetical protein
MNRRKFIAGFGSLAAVVAGAVGTNAFTSVKANRTVNVEVAGDDKAFLALQKAEGVNSDPGVNSDAYVNVNGGEVSFDFSSNNGTADLGNGFNKNAVVEIEDLLEVKNQGTQSVHLSIDLADLDISDSSGNNAYVGLAVVANETASGVENENIAFDSDTSGSNVGGDVPDPTIDGPYELGTGESVHLDLTVDTRDFEDTGVSTSGTVTFIADQDSSL